MYEIRENKEMKKHFFGAKAFIVGPNPLPHFAGSRPARATTPSWCGPRAASSGAGTSPSPPPPASAASSSATTARRGTLSGSPSTSGRGPAQCARWTRPVRVRGRRRTGEGTTCRGCAYTRVMRDQRIVELKALPFWCFCSSVAACNVCNVVAAAASPVIIIIVDIVAVSSDVGASAAV